MLRPGYHSHHTDADVHSTIPRPSSAPSAIDPSTSQPATGRSPTGKQSSVFSKIFSGMLREQKHYKHDDEDNKSKSSGFFGREGTVLGFPPRLIIFFSILLVILFMTGVVPTFRSNDLVAQHHASFHSALTSHDYLNASLIDPAPFPFCPLYGPGDEVANRRGQLALMKSKMHLGSGARVQKVIRKALSGHPVTISVLGASISACHGSGDNLVSPKCYPSKFFSWWNDVFPHPASELTNGANRRTDSSYFAFCSSHHLPDKTDLVILEFDAADPNEKEWMSHYELLVRSILVRPDAPAIISLGHFAPQIVAQHAYAGPEQLHNTVAQFYDIPHISVKGLLYHDYMNRPEEVRNSYYADPILANPHGHDLIADVLIHYIQSQVCLGWAAAMGHGFDVPVPLDLAETNSGGAQLLGGVGLRKGMREPNQLKAEGDTTVTDPSTTWTNALRVPSTRLIHLPTDVEGFREIEPFCASANDMINPLPPSLFYGSGWMAHHPKPGDQEDRHYWFAETPYSRLRVPVKLGAGDVGVYHLSGPLDSKLGSALCWVDDNIGGGKTIHGAAAGSEIGPKLTMIDFNVEKGSHFVECQLLGEEGKLAPQFQILGIFAT
ncbi:SGNH hydrolase-type esterase domain [Phaffia rhodozyma]|uniref:SGNH hydrolase-type esterase domain n=1 Tax=Phaffia rhodozyma TaxID=264483 RepID=A0A0F7SKQ8_PHARH|nr:SGNH hydrolase-type esterase domain [Phaffia rhodozyma]